MKEIRHKLYIFYLRRYCNGTLDNYGLSLQSTIRSYLPSKFQPHMLCAGIEDLSCDGGSGGSLFIYNTRGLQFTLIGIQIRGFASNCNDQNYPEMFVRLDHPEVLQFVISKADEVLGQSECRETTFGLCHNFF